ncbi:MAG: glycosyltransferase family 2 protein [Saprospiraceae bacterium]
MSIESNLTVLIPAFNEVENLRILLPQWIQLCSTRNWKLILVDDGSTDDTREFLKGFAVDECFKLIRHKLNKGYGAAIKSGIQQCNSSYCITIDADGQHQFSDVVKLYERMVSSDADLIVGSRLGSKSASQVRGIGKSIIRRLAKMLMTIPIHDLNSGMKLYQTELAKKYLHLTPDTMAYSDIIALVFINNKHLVLEEPIQVAQRMSGKSTIGIQTAFQTVMEIINIVVLFNPMKVFLPISLLALVSSLIWGIPLMLKGYGVSTGTLLGIISAVIFFVLGLIAEQLTLIRKNQK